MNVPSLNSLSDFLKLRPWFVFALAATAAACGSKSGVPSDKGDPDVVGAGGAGGEGAGSGQNCAPGTSGKTCSECKSGTYCAGGDAPEVGCAAGTFDHDQDPSTACKKWSECQPGTLAKKGTAVLDRTCEACPVGTFSAGSNATECTPKQTCEAGTFVEKEGSASSDRSCNSCASGSFSTKANASACSPFTTCKPGEFISAVGNATSDQTCSPCASGEISSTENASKCLPADACAAGTYEKVPASSSTPAVCESCVPGEFCAGGNAPQVLCAAGTWDHDSNPATDCVAQTTCLAGEYVTNPGSTTEDRSCQNCAEGTFSTAENAANCDPVTVCVAGQFVTRAGGASEDRLCASCGSGTFSSSDNATECLPWSDCVAGQSVASEGSNTADRTCTTCALGTFSTDLNESVCRDWTDCTAGQFVVSEPSTTDDRVCSACSSGTFSTGLNEAVCLVHSDCPTGTFVANVPDEKTDRTCTSCPTGTYADQINLSACLPLGACAAGTLEVSPGTPSQAAVCSACEAGTYCAGAQAPKLPCDADSFDEDLNSATACSPKTNCIAGESVLSSGSSTQDRTCAVCEDGSFSSSTNALSCVRWSDCSAGESVSVPGSTTSNRSCEACATGTFSSTTNASICTAFADCGAGQYEVAAGTSNSNRVCAGCPSGTFNTSLNASSCTSWSDCSAGTFVSEAPSAQKDRVCTACAPGSYTSDANLSLCLSQNACPAGTIQTAPGTATAPPTCAACSAGTYCAGGSNSALACAGNEWDDDNDPSTACVSKTNCVPGQFVTSSGDALTDRVCSSCASSTFSSTSNAASCSGWTTCAAGSYVASAGSASADRVCSVCPSGTISFNTNSPSCEAIVAKGIAAGGSHTCAVLTDGSLRCFGLNTYGQLGYGNTTQIGDNETPSAAGAVSVGGGVKQVSAGTEHTCVLLNDGNVRCFGRNNYGQLGLGNTTSIGDNELPSSWSVVSLGGTATAIAAGATHTCALLSNGAVRCWGRNNVGQLGYGNLTQIGDNELPSSVGTVSLGETATAIAAGTEFTCALLASGGVKCWGRNNYGQLGQGNTLQIGDDELPSTVGTISLGETAVAIASGATHSCAILSSGALRCWGRSNYGQLGYQNTTTIGDTELPSSVGAVDIGGTATAIAAGASHTCAVLSGGALRCFGRSNVGQLGYGNTQSVGDNELPSFVSPVSVGASLSAVVTFNEHTCGLTTNGGVRCWGRNTNGQLGLANTNNIGDNELPSSQPLLTLY